MPVHRLPCAHVHRTAFVSPAIGDQELGFLVEVVVLVVFRALLERKTIFGNSPD